MMIDAPYKSLATTSHKQIRNDYCGPATMAIIDHFLRGSTRHWSQNEWAAYKYNGSPLWTDADGAFMWVMAMGLKEKTGKAYAYTSGNTTTQVYERTRYGIDRGRPVAYGLRSSRRIGRTTTSTTRGISSAVEATIGASAPSNWTTPIPRTSTRPAGATRTGSKTYSKGVVAGGVTGSTNKQVVY